MGIGPGISMLGRDARHRDGGYRQENRERGQDGVASAEQVAVTTILAADNVNLPVSSTHGSREPWQLRGRETIS